MCLDTGQLDWGLRREELVHSGAEDYASWLNMGGCEPYSIIILSIWTVLGISHFIFILFSTELVSFGEIVVEFKLCVCLSLAQLPPVGRQTWLKINYWFSTLSRSLTNLRSCWKKFMSKSKLFLQLQLHFHIILHLKSMSLGTN